MIYQSPSRLVSIIFSWVIFSWMILVVTLGIGTLSAAEVTPGVSSEISPVVKKSASYRLYTQSLPPYSMMMQPETAVSEGAGSLIEGTQSGAVQQSRVPPMKADGLAVEIVEQLFSRSGISSSVQILPWSRAYRMAASDVRSCLFPVQRTQEREAQFQWISPLIVTETGFFTRADSPTSIRSLDDVRDLRIASYRGNAIAEYLTDFGYDVDISNDEFVNLKRLQIKRVDVWAADTLTAAYFIKQSSAKDIQNQLTFFTTLRGLACNIAVPTEVIEELRRQLKIMYADGTIEQIRDKYR